MIYSADFETTTNPDDCRVWAWASCEVSKNPELYSIGNSIEGFYKWAINEHNPIIYFHNAKFDTDFIMNYLFRIGYKWVESIKYIKEKEFTTLISDDGKFYSMSICSKGFPNKNIIEIRDSQKLLNMSVSAIAKTFKLKESKLSIDYDAAREEGHELTAHEIEYIKADITIVAKAIKELFDTDTTRLTIGSNALARYTEMIGGKKRFRKIFPLLDTLLDHDLRQAYKGGFTYLSPLYKEKEVQEGFVLDVNSLYPWAMHSPNLIPYGRPVYYEGKYKADKLHPLYIQRIICQFNLKKNKIPTIQLKNNMSFIPTEYLKSSNNQLIALTLTNIDLELFLEQYNVKELKYICGWKFKAAAGLFDSYIDYFTEMKINATKEKNAGMRAIAKLYLNSLYGKFATSPKVRSAIPYLNDGKISYRRGVIEERDTVYLPVGIFITSIARNKTIRSAQSVYERFIYADTDSLHLVGMEHPENLDIDDYRLGAWKVEEEFRRGKYIRQKCYIEEIKIDEKTFAEKQEKHEVLCNRYDGVPYFLKVTCAGLPESAHNNVTWNNFATGAEYAGKLSPKHVAGGTVLTKTTFTIKSKSA